MSENNLSPISPSPSPVPINEGTQVVLPASPQKFPFLVIFLLILLSLVATFAIYLFIQVRTLSLEKTSPSPTPTPVASPDSTVDWQTYTNTKYHYSFRYPNDLTIRTGVERLPGNEAERTLSSTVSIILFKNDNVVAQISSTQESRSLDQIKNSIESTNQDRSVEFTDTSLSFRPAFKYIVDNWTYVEAINNNVLYEISTGDVELLDQILSTFKFTDPENQITSACEYQGQTYQEGESLKIDKCNSCSCSNGQISCTFMACE